MLKETYYVYEIFNEVTQRRYIGYTEHYSKRVAQHCCQLKRLDHTAQGIIEDCIKYGIDHFRFNVLYMTNDKRDALIHESMLMRKYKTQCPEYGYNGYDSKFVGRKRKRKRR